MKYMLLIYFDEQAGLSEIERQECYAESTQLAQQIHANGHFLGAHPLHPTAMATSVRVRNGKRLVTDGPFAEAKEYLGSFTILDCDSLERALEIAARNPSARYWGVEVRPLMHEANVEP